MKNLVMSMNTIKRQRWFLTIIVGVLVCFSMFWINVPCRACTSFATYATKPIYGMNFDYPAHLELRFAITDHNGVKVFRQQFVQGSMIADIAGMNTHGLLSTQQIVAPVPATTTGQSSTTVYLWDLFNGALTQLANIPQVIDWLSARTLIHYPDIPLHSLLADVSGQAIVAEVGEQGNAITPTRCSMVFDPIAQEIYVALEADFEKIWKVSLQDGTMETWKGFTEPDIFPLTVEGVLASSLQQ